MSSKMVELHMPPETPDGYILSPNKAFRLAVIAPSGSGKSFLIAKLLLSPKPFLHKAFYRVSFIDPTFQHTTQNNPYKYIDIEDEDVYEEATDEVINHIFKSAPRNPNNDELLPQLMILDDTGQLKGSGKDSSLAKKMFIKARHYATSIIGSFQKLSFLPRPVRQSLSHIILFKSQNKTMLEEFMEEFMPFDRDTSQAIIKYATTPDEDLPYPFLFIDLQRMKFYKGFDTEIKIQEEDGENVSQRPGTVGQANKDGSHKNKVE
jgi:hypothetical protein